MVWFGGSSEPSDPARCRTARSPQASAPKGVVPAWGKAWPSMHWAVVVLLRRRDDHLDIDCWSFVLVPLITVPSGAPREGVPPRKEGLVPVQDGESGKQSVQAHEVLGGPPDGPSRSEGGSALRLERPCVTFAEARRFQRTRGTFGSESEETASPLRQTLRRGDRCEGSGSGRGASKKTSSLFDEGDASLARDSPFHQG